MDDRFLHENERLLCSQHATPAVLILSWLRGLLDAIVIGAVIDVILFALVTWQSLQPSPWLYAIAPVLAYVVVAVLRYHVWQHATFRVTTERILAAEPFHLTHAPLHTLKWSQYQESLVGHRSFLDVFFLARSLVIRHGTADARLELEFPSLRYAHDLKHYLDKVDSAVRKNETESIKPFVAKPRGKRDM
jgi:hypothetical protein